MKTLLVTKDRFVTVPGDADLYLKDADYVKLMVDCSFRHKFLKSFGVDKLYIQRLGYANKGLYETDDFNIRDLNDNEFEAEVGVIAKLC